MNRVTNFGVHLKVASIEASRSFYEDYLDLTPTFAYGDEAFLATVPNDVASAPDVYRGVTYEISETARIEIADGHIAVTDPEVFIETIHSPKVSAMITVSSLAALLEKSPIRPKHGVVHYYWGTLEMVLRDPDGWVIVLITPHSDEEEMAVARFVDVAKVEPKG